VDDPILRSAKDSELVLKRWTWILSTSIRQQFGGAGKNTDEVYDDKMFNLQITSFPVYIVRPGDACFVTNATIIV
jgi:hypothetical protein